MMVGVGTLVGWYFSGNNIIVNDLVCFCLMVGSIKLFKFTSLKMSMIMMLTFLCF